MKPFYFDIETVPAQDPAIRAELAASVQAPAQYKKPESIAEWLAENREREAEAAWLKTSFDGGVGQIVCIGWADGDGDPRAFFANDLSRKEEVYVIESFFRAVSAAGSRTFVGHNIIGSDLPFLWKRCMVLGIRPPSLFPRNPKPWSELVTDTMLLWDPAQRSGGSMDRLCRLLGIPGKGDISGADVWPLAQAGKFEQIAAYCCGDVERTRSLHRRMTFTAPRAGEADALAPAF